jgi:hypothetical protein
MPNNIGQKTAKIYNIIHLLILFFIKTFLSIFKIILNLISFFGRRNKQTIYQSQKKGEITANQKIALKIKNPPIRITAKISPT